MTQTTFIKALHKEAPGLISEWARTHPDDGMPVTFRLTPDADGVQLSLKIGEAEPHELLFASEGDAAKFLGRLYKSVKFQESAFSLPLR